jgi:hypothetical protein
MTIERNPSSRALVERALYLLLNELGDVETKLVVLGGLVPETLTRDQVPPVTPHLGTTDVDLLLLAHLDASADTANAEIERALIKLGFENIEDGWRWRVLIDGVPIKMEFLCDIDDAREGECRRPAGCAELTAINLRGTGYVARDFSEEVLTIGTDNDAATTVKVRYAGLQGYLLSKASAVRMRAAEKDYYDFAYVLINNRDGGPRAAATLLRSGVFASELRYLRSTFAEIRERYRLPTDDGPRNYANESLKMDGAGNPKLLQLDAVAAVSDFIDELEILK